jgi:hypothetical protein
MGLPRFEFRTVPLNLRYTNIKIQKMSFNSKKHGETATSDINFWFQQLKKHDY